MKCPKCHYALTPFDADCPRCKNFAALGLVPASTPSQPTETDSNISNVVDGLNQPALTNDSGEPWYSKLDFDDKKPVKETPVTRLETKLPAAEEKSVDLAHPASERLLPSFERAVCSPMVFNSIPPVPIRPQLGAEDIPIYAAPIYSPPMILRRTAETQRLGKPAVSILMGFAVLMLLALMMFRITITSHERNAVAKQMLTQANKLIAQANRATTLFQQADFSPEQASDSIHTRMLQYQKAMRLCKAAQLSGAGQPATILQQAATSGLRHIQADKRAQAARTLTTEVADSITHYKGQTLTDEQAALIRSMLKAKCQSALVDCTQSLQSDPTNSIALAERVRALRYLGDEKSADTALAQALILCPNSPVLLAAKGTHG